MRPPGRSGRRISETSFREFGASSIPLAAPPPCRPPIFTFVCFVSFVVENFFPRSSGAAPVRHPVNENYLLPISAFQFFSVSAFCFPGIDFPVIRGKFIGVTRIREARGRFAFRRPSDPISLMRNVSQACHGVINETQRRFPAFMELECRGGPVPDRPGVAGVMAVLDDAFGPHPTSRAGRRARDSSFPEHFDRGP